MVAINVVRASGKVNLLEMLRFDQFCFTSATTAPKQPLRLKSQRGYDIVMLTL